MLFEIKFEISTNIIGHEPDDEKQFKVLNRIITVEDDGYIRGGRETRRDSDL